jgi:glycosyltransferase involved in cell wall biosynthesis
VKTIAILYERELDYGGVETHLLALLRKLPTDEFSFVIVSPVSKRFRDAAQALGARIYPFAHWSAFNPIAIIELGRVMKREGVDLVHAQSPIAAAPGRLAARMHRLPVVVTVHLPVTRYHGTRQTLRARSGRWVYINLDRFLNHAMTDTLVYVAQRVRDESVATLLSPAERCIVIPNGINLEDFQRSVDRDSLRRSFNLPQSARVITFIGRLDEQKGLDLLLEATAHLETSVEGVEVWLVGDGPVRTELQRLATKLGIDDRVKFWGYQAQIERYLYASDIFALPSRYEGMPIVLLEALAAGIPCVVSRVGDNDLVVEDGKQGLVVPPNDAAALAKALNLLLLSPEMQRQMSEAATRRSEDFSDENMAQRYAEVYRALLSRR